MKRILLYKLLLIVLIAFTSCEGNTTKERIIKNSSLVIIHVEVSTNWDNPDTLDINSGEEALISITDDLGGSSYADNPSNGIKELVITNINNDTIIKDYNLKDNWDIEIEEVKKIPSNYHHRYTFVVNDSDF